MDEIFGTVEKNKKYRIGPTEIWTRIAGFRVQSANHYTMGPLLIIVSFPIYLNLGKRTSFYEAQKLQLLSRDCSANL